MGDPVQEAAVLAEAALEQVEVGQMVMAAVAFPTVYLCGGRPVVTRTIMGAMAGEVHQTPPQGPAGTLQELAIIVIAIAAGTLVLEGLQVAAVVIATMEQEAVGTGGIVGRVGTSLAVRTCSPPRIFIPFTIYSRMLFPDREV